MLGLRIAALRQKQGLSQAELARRIHVSASSVGMYEQGRREPSLAILVDLAKQLKVSTDYLLTGECPVDITGNATVLIKFHGNIDENLNRVAILEMSVDDLRRTV